METTRYTSKVQADSRRDVAILNARSHREDTRLMAKMLDIIAAQQGLVRPSSTSSSSSRASPPSPPPMRKTTSSQPSPKSAPVPAPASPIQLSNGPAAVVKSADNTSKVPTVDEAVAEITKPPPQLTALQLAFQAEIKQKTRGIPKKKYAGVEGIMAQLIQRNKAVLLQSRREADGTRDDEDEDEE